MAFQICVIFGTAYLIKLDCLINKMSQLDPETTQFFLLLQPAWMR